MKSLLIAVSVLFFHFKSISQIISIPIKKIEPIRLLREYVKIVDTSGQFIKHEGYQMNQRFWKIHMTRALLDKKSDTIKLNGVVTMSSELDDPVKLSNYSVYLGRGIHDTLTNIKHLDVNDYLKKDGSFEVQFDLKEYSFIIFFSPHRLPHIYDLSFLLAQSNYP